MSLYSIVFSKYNISTIIVVICDEETLNKKKYLRKIRFLERELGKIPKIIEYNFKNKKKKSNKVDTRVRKDERKF